MQEDPFANLPTTPVEHFKLYCFAAISHLLRQVEQSFETQEALLAQFPFLADYYEELSSRAYQSRPSNLDELTLAEVSDWWREALHNWERNIAARLPLREMRDATKLDFTCMILLISVGLVEEDARFGILFEAMHGLAGQHRPTLGLLNAWWRDATDYADIRAMLRQLRDLGLVQVVNPDAPRIEWALQVPALLWDLLRGDTHQVQVGWLRYRAPTELATDEELIIEETLQHSLVTLHQLLADGEVQALAIRGPQHNGRRTLLGTIARKLERGMLEITGLTRPDDERWRLIGPLATLLHALPTIILDLAPGESTELPGLNGYNGPIGIIMGKHGGVLGPTVERTLTITLEMPGIEARRLHWQHGFAIQPAQSTQPAQAIQPLPTEQFSEELEEISTRLRVTSGNLRRIAHLAQSYATLAGHTTITLADVQQASRSLNRQALETLATPIKTSGDWSHLAVGAETLHELTNLEKRCRYREQLHSAVGAALGSQLNAGVRALFSGPSGTGKTLAARLLASVLQMDLYRLDLASVVNKYIGETEKNLNQVFACAEEMDVILLLDEGDALLTQRTNVQNSNDRYANLETNYLLQRLEEFEGILLVSTNAGNRIDNAFQRRMDVVVEFHAPEAPERWTIWKLHLPSNHRVEPTLLREIAARCALSGGQIRNAVLHASLLGLDDGGVITSVHLEAAVQREYRKAGGVCPLRRTAALNGRT